ncbi:MAG: hypothetical protein VX944_16160 [Myxococcota bacterium]|nr:hypothetical protein [Myxococcota bacterium]MEC9391606.1 hypothetical protein [Myxococcota bacterium]
MLAPMLGFHLLIQGLLAAPPYNAIPPIGVDGLGSPHFQGSSTGWTALVDDGYVAVFVGRNADAAQHWVDRKVEALSIYSPTANSTFLDATGVDAALGDGVGLMIFRAGNLAAMSRHKSDASGWATTLHAAIVAIDEPWPAEPTLQQTAQGWVPVKNEAIVHLQFSGGQTTTDPSLAFSERPDKLVSWDQWGRAAVATSQHSATSP